MYPQDMETPLTAKKGTFPLLPAGRRSKSKDRCCKLLNKMKERESKSEWKRELKDPL